MVHFHGSDRNLTYTVRHVAWLTEHGFHVFVRLAVEMRCQLRWGLQNLDRREGGWWVVTVLHPDEYEVPEGSVVVEYELASARGRRSNERGYEHRYQRHREYLTPAYG